MANSEENLNFKLGTKKGKKIVITFYSVEKPNLTSSEIIVFLIIIAHVICLFHYDTETCFMAWAVFFPLTWHSP